MGVLGPVDFRAFRRLASTFLEETVRFPFDSAAISCRGSAASCPLLFAGSSPVASKFPVCNLACRFFKFLPGEQRQAFAQFVTEKIQ